MSWYVNKPLALSSLALPYPDMHLPRSQIIAPGSQTTLAQLGLPESFTPARLRISTRMFPAEKSGEWEPLKVREKKNSKPSQTATSDVNGGQDAQSGNGLQVITNDVELETTYEEDPSTDEGAVYPLKGGRVVNWSCFFALLTHVYNTLSPPFHTPIIVISQPAWTEQDLETLTQFFFEKFKTPAFCLMDSALTTCYAYGLSTATVIDIGYEKCDVTAVSDFLVTSLGRGTAIEGCGGVGMTQKLFELLGSKGFTKEMCEQLKRSAICEVLPPNASLPAEADGANGAVNGTTNSIAAASTGHAANGQRGSVSGQIGLPRGPGLGTEVGEEDQDRDIQEGEDNDGVLDVASIVVSGKTSEFLAKKEREKAERAAAKKAAADAASAPKPTRLPNSQRPKATFHYEERRSTEELNENAKRANEDETAQEVGDSKRQRTPEPATDAVESTAMNRKEEKRRNKYTSEFVRKDIEVGTERFRAAERILDRVADSVHRCVLSVPEVSRRSELWDSMIILGNGSKTRGITKVHYLTI